MFYGCKSYDANLLQLECDKVDKEIDSLYYANCPYEKIDEAVITCVKHDIICAEADRKTEVREEKCVL